MTKEEIEEIGKLMMGKKIKELQKIVDDSKATGKQKHRVIVVIFAGMALKAMKGDSGAFDALLNRLIGRVPSDLKLSNPDGTMRPQVFIGLPNNGRDDDTGSDEPDQG